jgi:uncharacterized protein DUF5994
VNGLTGARRLARPVRLALARRLGGDIDGAWWPHTGLVARELPELIEVLHRPLGEIVDICINWSTTEAAIDLSSVVSGARWQQSERRRRHRLMAVVGRKASAKLLVVPHLTSRELGAMVMRYAADMPVPASEHTTVEYETAEIVLKAAREESASWALPVHDLDAAESTAVPGRNRRATPSEVMR